jgi:hypothetical protein
MKNTAQILEEKYKSNMEVIFEIKLGYHQRSLNWVKEANVKSINESPLWRLLILGNIREVITFIKYRGH